MLQKEKSRSKTVWIVAGLLTLYFIWGTTYLAMKIGLESIPAFAFAGGRFLVAGTGTFLFLLMMGVAVPTLNQWRNAGLVGLLLMVGGNGFVMWAIQTIPSGIAAVIVATMPMWMVLFDWWFFKGQPPSKRVVFGLCLGFVGIILLINPFGAVQEGETSLDIFGCFICLLAPVFWSFGSLYSRNRDLPANVMMSIAVQMALGGVALLVISLLVGEYRQIDFASISLRSWLAAIYLIVFGSIIALGTYMWLLRNAAASTVSTYTYVNPVIAVILGWLILAESISIQMLIAIGIILTAVLLIVLSQNASSKR